MSKQLKQGMSYPDIFFQRDVINSIAVGIIGCFVVAHLIWILEHRMYAKNPILPLYYQFRPHYLDGLKDGMWFSTSTVLGDVGSSLKLPQTSGGRVLATIWVMFGLFLISFVTSVISSTLTEAMLQSSNIYSVNDAAGKRVCMKAGPYETLFSNSFAGVGILKTTYTDESECYAALEANNVDAVFGLREDMVAYFQTGKGNGKLISTVQKTENYAFIWQELWPYAYSVNSAILTLKDDSSAAVIDLNPSFPSMLSTWYEGDINNVLLGSSVPTTYNWGVIIAAIVLTCLYFCLNVFVWIAEWVIKGKGGVLGFEFGFGPGLAGSTSGLHSADFPSNNSNTDMDKSISKSIARVASKLSSTIAIDVVASNADKNSSVRSQNSISTSPSVDIQKVAKALGDLKADVSTIKTSTSINKS
eukprot:CAMPEP_0175059624 /NCGR_PEP_ID=MMETSP0052_2-20121109/12535_1 /TAXON_ID=51329 ORGANISM="Polytomella parva, Strain SAG 63-3" /NCGR_SAMPLE_ID=MMETSP0052_2 /ASSEMBLY_ACC=CAM_ASM_000194 /LENGTH=415 /DNA_ID=CAMNT_0016325193 /DNA_START=437 /DNA_END=1684 /DNA_ORIENTATION=+